MTKKHYQMIAVDDGNAQAMYEHGEKKYLVRLDDSWEPKEITEQDVTRNMMRGAFSVSDAAFPSLDALIESVRTSSGVKDIPDVPLEDIIHHFSPEMQAEFAARHPKRNPTDKTPGGNKKR